MNRFLERQAHTVEVMIRLYCRKKEGNKELCDNCRHLIGYARQRLSMCPFADSKPTCKRCTVHCYSPEMRRAISVVMRWAGPRMLLYHPLLALRHLLHESRSPRPRK